MSNDPDAGLRRLARAMVADDDPPPTPPWPLDATEVAPGGPGPWGGRRFLVAATALVLVIGAIAGLIGISMGDDAAPADAPASTVPATSVAPSTTTPPPPTTIAPTIASPATTSPTSVTSAPSSPAPASSAAPTPTNGLAGCAAAGQDFEYPLRRCDVGLAVGVMKQQLIAKGYLPPSAADDAVFDDQVEAAVRAFQADQHLAVDGLVGPITWAAIVADYQRAVVDPNGDGRLDPAEIYTIGDANEQ